MNFAYWTLPIEILAASAGALVLGMFLFVISLILLDNKADKNAKRRRDIKLLALMLLLSASAYAAKPLDMSKYTATCVLKQEIKPYADPMQVEWQCLKNDNTGPRSYIGIASSMWHQPMLNIGVELPSQISTFWGHTYVTVVYTEDGKQKLAMYTIYSVTSIDRIY